MGDIIATDFFMIEETTGRVGIKKNLKTDRLKLKFYTLVLEAFDSANPRRRAQTTLTVEVQRNRNTPRFSENPYTATANESYALGQSIVIVKAEDKDNVSWKIFIFRKIC